MVGRPDDYRSWVVMALRIVIIGGVAAGMSAAMQAKRRRPDADVVVLERGSFVAYGACGIPYNLEDPRRNIEDLVVRTPEEFRAQGIDVRLGHEALSIDVARKIVRVRHGADDQVVAYDKLILATGASPVVPPIPGLDQPGVYVLRDLSDAAKIKERIAAGGVARAVIVGGGYIGMEMAEALRERGIAVTIVERLDRVVFGFEPAISDVVLDELVRHDVRVETGASVAAIDADLSVRTSAGTFAADLVLVSVGVRPNVVLAGDAGIALGPTGAIAVDERMRTNLPDVFAAGDCAEAHHLVADAPAYVPLGTTANKQGKVAGANAAGAAEVFVGIVGTAAFRVFELEVGRTGLGRAEIERAGRNALTSISKHASRGHAFPGSATLTTVLFVERGTGRLIGAQMAGRGVVGTRIDVFATALHANMTVEDIERLDLAYAPPIAPVYDPILIAASVARKDLERARHG
jgi:NADPH-dependent 2,4-dienoyl-CoA reductase/sulfur reductase-like enzyme